jgi:hypothetical protein
MSQQSCILQGSVTCSHMNIVTVKNIIVSLTGHVLQAHMVFPCHMSACLVAQRRAYNPPDPSIDINKALELPVWLFYNWPLINYFQSTVTAELNSYIFWDYAMDVYSYTSIQWATKHLGLWLGKAIWAHATQPVQLTSKFLTVNQVREILQ